MGTSNALSLIVAGEGQTHYNTVAVEVLTLAPFALRFPPTHYLCLALVGWLVYPPARCTVRAPYLFHHAGMF